MIRITRRTMCAHHRSDPSEQSPEHDARSTSASAPPATTVDHVGISVGDLNTAVTFYSAAFGLVEEFRFAVEEAGPMHAVILRSPDGWAVELMHRPDSVEPQRRYAQPDQAVLNRGHGHLCLRVRDLDDSYQQILAAGASVVVPPGPARHPAVRYAYAADPDGNLLELIHVHADGVLGVPA